MATTFVRMYYSRSFSSIHFYPSLSLDLYIDDIGLIATGKFRDVLRGLKHGSAAAFKAVVDELHCEVAPNKAGVIASCPKLGKCLQEWLGKFSGSGTSSSAINLGIDGTAGKTR
eukprot:969656-Pyramimonas_sp.AAC.1